MPHGTLRRADSIVPVGRLRSCGLVLLALLVLDASGPAAPLGAQVVNLETPTDRGREVVSMGQPATWRYFAAGDVGLAPIDAREFVGRFSLGVERTLLNPLANAFAVSGEYFMGISGQAEGEVGVRLGLESPVLRFGGGWQYEFKEGRGRGYVSFKHPLRRGGAFWDGSYFRVLWAPGRDQSLTFGATVPLAQPFAGRTRPRRVTASVALPVADLPPALPAAPEVARSHLDRATREADRVRRFYVPFVDHDAGNRDQAVRAFGNDVMALSGELLDVAAEHDGSSREAGRWSPPELSAIRFHEAIQNAFAAACSACDVPPAVFARTARESLLDELIFPYNRMLGREKEDEVLDELAARARVDFSRRIVLGSGVSLEVIRPAEAVFAQVVEIVRRNVQEANRQWGDDRMVWIPLQYGLRPEDHDSQSELDALVSRAVAKPFMRDTRSWYVVSEDFQYELLRMINDARLYHVLWIHDFRGYDDGGDPDAVAFKIVMEGYLNALAERLESFDRDGELPVYLIFIDQWFYEANKGRLWLDLLENPLTHTMDLPEGFEDWEGQIAQAQDRLRRAIAASPLLQAQIREYGEDWLRNRVKVQVNVTNPADQTFGVRALIPWIGFPDALMRDHRKITFYDVMPRDPNRGAALYTGMGVGEHYTGATWDDRAIRVEGPVLLYLRTEARDLLLQQGFAPEEIPFPLAEVDGELRGDLVATGPGTLDSAPGLQLHNHIGYGPKDATVLKATLYNLMPGGAVAKAPDSLWNLPLWSSLMLGHALRGGRVVVVAPTLDTAPARSSISLSRAQEVLARLVVAQRFLAEPLAASGGFIRVGLYNPESGVGDIPGKARQLAETLRSQQWLADLLAVSPEDADALEAVGDALDEDGFRARYLQGEALDRPKLHLKAHLFVTREGWDALVARPESKAFMGEYLRARAVQVSEREQDRDLKALAEAIRPARNQMFRSYQGDVTADEASRAAWFLLVGSHNQNYRSMALDGEVVMTIAGPQALEALPDFVLILGLSTWLDAAEDLEAYLPAASEFFRGLSRWIEIVS